MSFVSARENSDFKSIMNNWNNFLIENKIEEDLSLKIEKILSENKLFISNENILNPKNKNIKNNNLNEAASWLPIIGTGILVLPTVVKLISAAIDAVKDKKVSLGERIREAFDEDFGHQAIPLDKALEKKNSKLFKAFKYILAIDVPNEPVHVHSKKNDGKEFVIVYGQDMTTEEKDRAIDEYNRLHNEEESWSWFRKTLTKICHIIHHSVQSITEFVPRLIMKAFNTVTKTEHNEIKEVIISVLGNLISLAAIIFLVNHAIHVIPTLTAGKAGAEGAITVGHTFELVIEVIEVMMELKLMSKSLIKIWKVSKEYLNDTRIVKFIKALCEGGKAKIKSLLSFIKSIFDQKGVEYTEESQPEGNQ